MRPITKLFAAIVLCLFFAACSREQAAPWQTKSIAGLMPDLQFAMTDDHGRKVTAADFRGKTVVMFFGYTHCPDVCPTTLARLAQAVGAMDTHRDDVRVLFVTVDPDRDTTAQLREYVQAFGKEFIGLRGTSDALHELTRRYRVSYSLGKPDAHGNYEVTHSSGAFVFDARGQARLLARPNDTVAAITADLERVSAANGGSDTGN